MENTTLVVQGDLKEDTYKFYCRFYPSVNKIFSTWEGNEKSMRWKNIANLHSPSDFFIVSKKPERFGIYEINLERRVVGTLVAMEKVATKQCIILRGDEWYSNLDCVGNFMSDAPDRIHTTNVFFRKWEICPFHIGDHVLAGSTENLRLMFGRTMINMVTKKELGPKGKPMPAAAILGKSYMEAKFGQSSDWKGDFVKSFGMVPLERLKYYKVVSDDSGIVWYSNLESGKEFSSARDGTWERSISRMEDL